MKEVGLGVQLALWITVSWGEALLMAPVLLSYAPLVFTMLPKQLFMRTR